MRPPHLLHLMGSPGRRVTSSWQAARGRGGREVGRRQVTTGAVGGEGRQPRERRVATVAPKTVRKLTRVLEQELATRLRCTEWRHGVPRRWETSRCGVQRTATPASVLSHDDEWADSERRSWACSSRQPEKEEGEGRKKG